jgi:hypothetical protein
MDVRRQRQWRPAEQPDLFLPSPTTAALSLETRAKLLPLIQDLLTEITAAEVAATPGEEDRHDEDHA